jgi:hypothetical protein
MTCVNRSKLCRFSVGLLLACLALTSFAQTEEEINDLDKEWKEIALTLPEAPKEANLLPFSIGPIATQRFFIDSQSVTVGKDAVVRYTLVSISSSGAKNISYEGMRCDVRQRRLYAFGRPDGSWSRARTAEWEKINPKAANRQHATLASDFLCNAGMVSGTAAQIIQRIRNNDVLSPIKDS